MKKLIAVAVLMLMVAVPAYADWFDGRTRQDNLRASQGEDLKVSAGLVDAWSPADIIGGLAGKLGVKEGFIFNFEREEFSNYLASTIWTSDNGIAVNVGMIGLDGVIASIDYNIGAAISQEDVPLISLFEYLYIGYGIGYQDQDGSNVDLADAADWELVHGPTVVFKATF